MFPLLFFCFDAFVVGACTGWLLLFVVVVVGGGSCGGVIVVVVVVGVVGVGSLEYLSFVVVC